VTRRWAWRGSPAPPAPPRAPAFEVPGTGVRDLYRYLVIALNAVPPSLRRNAVWVMDGYWLAWVRSCPPAARPGLTSEIAAAPPSLYLLGLPVTVLPDGGWPHLEPAQRTGPPPSPGSRPSPARAQPGS
jgi:hypothetical protein